MSELMLLVNIVTIILLIAGLLYSMRLSKRIDLFLKSREDLSALFRMFDETIAQAQAHTARLAEEAASVSTDLQQSADEARLLLQDLRQTCVRAEKVYDKAERGLMQLARGQGATAPKVVKNDEPEPSAEPQPKKPIHDAEERKRKEQMLEKVLRKASMLKKKNAGALPPPAANAEPMKPIVTKSQPEKPAAPKPKTAVKKEASSLTSKAAFKQAGDIEDAGEAIKRALSAMGFEEGLPVKKKN